MRFLRRYQYVLCFLGVVVFSLIMVTRQLLAERSAHVQRREDFLLLHERGRKDTASRMYQELIQELPALSEDVLANDLQRSALLVNIKSNDVENLVWKFYVSVGNELRRRAEHRLVGKLEDGGN